MLAGRSDGRLAVDLLDGKARHLALAHRRHKGAEGVRDGRGVAVVVDAQGMAPGFDRDDRLAAHEHDVAAGAPRRSVGSGGPAALGPGQRRAVELGGVGGRQYDGARLVGLGRAQTLDRAG